MAEHLLFSEGMKASPAHAAIAATFFGQAHIAGTGPEGETCRECIYWCLVKHRRLSSGGYEKYEAPPGYFGEKHKSHPGEIKKAKCNRPILNKANRLIPHHASACRLFERNEKAPGAGKLA